MSSYPFLNRDTDSVAGKISVIRLFPKVTTHQHSFFELIYVLQGSAIRKMPDSEILIRAGDFYVIPPFHVHGYADTQNFELLSCLFSLDDINRIFMDTAPTASLLPTQALRLGMQEGIPIIEQVFHDSDGSIRPVMRKIEQEYDNCQIGYIGMIRCYLAQVLVSICRSCENRSPHSAVAQVMEFLKVHYAENISLQALSQLVGYAPQYLSCLFSKEMNMSIQTCLQRIRVEEACTLLCRTSLSTAEVAVSVGYQDVRHFSKVFHRYKNLSPKEYRKAACTVGRVSVR